MFQECVLIEVHLHKSHFFFVDQRTDLFVIDSEVIRRRRRRRRRMDSVRLRLDESVVEIILMDAGVHNLSQIDLIQRSPKEIAVGENVRRGRLRKKVRGEEFLIEVLHQTRDGLCERIDRGRTARVLENTFTMELNQCFRLTFLRRRRRRR